MKVVIGWLHRDLDDEGEPYSEKWEFSKEKPYYGKEVKKIVYFEIEQEED